MEGLNKKELLIGGGLLAVVVVLILLTSRRGSSGGNASPVMLPTDTGATAGEDRQLALAGLAESAFESQLDFDLSKYVQGRTLDLQFRQSEIARELGLDTAAKALQSEQARYLSEAKIAEITGATQTAQIQAQAAATQAQVAAAQQAAAQQAAAQQAAIAAQTRQAEIQAQAVQQQASAQRSASIWSGIFSTANNVLGAILNRNNSQFSLPGIGGVRF